MGANIKTLHKKTALSVAITLLGCPPAFATNTPALTESVSIAAIESALAHLQSHSGIKEDALAFDDKPSDTIPVARIDDETAPIGLPETTVLLDSDDVAHSSVIDPKKNADTDPIVHLPSPPTLAVNAENDQIRRKPNLIKQLYAKFFNDGAQIAPKLSSAVYLARPRADMLLEAPPSIQVDGNRPLGLAVDGLWEDETKPDLSDEMTLVLADESKEPFKNIAAVIENITIDSVPSFSAGVPMLRQQVQSAAQAVGYYDISFRLRHEGGGKIGVIITHLGEPVLVDMSVVDIRGAGQTLEQFEKVAKQGEDLLGEPFHHGEYEQLKTDINTVSANKGFFDGRWLDSSADIVLPDNVADVNLVYDTGERYQFGEVVFFTRERATGQLTTDPEQLPVRADLLGQLTDFKTGDGFNRQKVVQLSNNITATRYFDTTSVELVFPERRPSESVVQASDNSATLGKTADDEAMVAPIEFSSSEQLGERLERVVAKAYRLYNSPNDRVLDEKTTSSTNILGKISDTISTLVKQILPDETIKDTVLDENQVLPSLANRKSPTQVYADKKVPVYVFVSSQRPKDAQIGLGWGSDTGMRATARLDNNLINKDGYQAGAEASFSANDKQINTYLSRPLSHPLNDKLIANASYLQESIKQKNTLTVSNRTAEARLSRTIKNPSDWHRTYGIRYRLDELKTDVLPDKLQDLPVWFGTGRPVQQALLFGGSLSKTVQNEAIAPTLGYRQHYSFEAGGRQLASDANMAIVRAKVGGVYSFGSNAYGDNRAHQILGRLDTGYLWADDFERVPYKLRFFTGGDQSIRGYDHQSISPVDDKGFLLGGQILLVGSGEYNYEVKEGLRAAAFFDVGGAYDSKFLTDTKVGVGVGVRYASPIGIVRADIAKGIEKNKTPFKFHFLIGLPF